MKSSDFMALLSGFRGAKRWVPFATSREWSIRDRTFCQLCQIRGPLKAMQLIGKDLTGAAYEPIMRLIEQGLQGGVQFPTGGIAHEPKGMIR